MKKFLSENWYKLMTGTSMLVFSFGFLIYAVSPTYANNSNKEEKTKLEKPLPSNDDRVIVTSNGYAYTWGSQNEARIWIEDFQNAGKYYKPKKRKLP